MIRALATVPAEPRLLIVGAGPERTRLLRYADDLGLGDRVEVRPVVVRRDAVCLRRRVVRRSRQPAHQDVGRAVRARSGRGPGRRSACDRELLGRDPRGSRGVRALRSSPQEIGSGSRACSRPAPSRHLRPSALHIRRRSSRSTRPRRLPKARVGLRPRPGGLGAVAAEDTLASPAGCRGEEVAVVGLQVSSLEQRRRCETEAPSRPTGADTPHGQGAARRDLCRRRGDEGCGSRLTHAFAARRPRRESGSGTRFRSHSSMNSWTCVVSSSPVERAKSSWMCSMAVTGRLWSKVFCRCGKTSTRWPSVPRMRLHSASARNGFAMCLERVRSHDDVVRRSFDSVQGGRIPDESSAGRPLLVVDELRAVRRCAVPDRGACEIAVVQSIEERIEGRGPVRAKMAEGPPISIPRRPSTSGRQISYAWRRE